MTGLIIIFPIRVEFIREILADKKLQSQARQRRLPKRNLTKTNLRF